MYIQCISHPKIQNINHLGPCSRKCLWTKTYPNTMYYYLRTNLSPELCSRPCRNLGHVAKFVLTLEHLWRCLKMVIRGGSRGGAPPPPPPKIGKDMIIWRKNRDFSHEIPQKCSRLPPLRSAQFFEVRSP